MVNKRINHGKNDYQLKLKENEKKYNTRKKDER